MSIKVNDRVEIVCGDCEGKTGVVRNVFDFAETAIVEVETGDICKIPFYNLAKVEETPEEEPQIEIPEGAKLITKRQYSDAVIEATKAMDNSMSLSSMGAMVVGIEAGDKIFDGAEEIVITADDFVSRLWTHCGPDSVSASVKGKSSVRDCFHIAATGVIILEKIIGILFPKVSENA